MILYYYKNTTQSIRGGYLRYIYQYIIQIPVKKPDFNLLQKLDGCATRMLEYNQELAKETVPSEKHKWNVMIDHTNDQINHLVYDLYGLTEEEIRIVEQTVHPTP